mmetsp:Transcript_26733/g.50908  ORF Transcript_26733/g.50908 Transcript_26733/m.50908 type:complete len:240 (+) Transcript_26733:248-967(+)
MAFVHLFGWWTNEPTSSPPAPSRPSVLGEVVPRPKGEAIHVHARAHVRSKCYARKPVGEPRPAHVALRVVGSLLVVLPVPINIKLHLPRHLLEATLAVAVLASGPLALSHHANLPLHFSEPRAVAVLESKRSEGAHVRSIQSAGGGLVESKHCAVRVDLGPEAAPFHVPGTAHDGAGGKVELLPGEVHVAGADTHPILQWGKAPRLLRHLNLLALRPLEQHRAAANSLDARHPRAGAVL